MDGLKYGLRTRLLRELSLVRTTYALHVVVQADSRASFLSSGGKQVGDQVNLERAMGAHVRFGGHFVQVNAHITTVY